MPIWLKRGKDVEERAEAGRQVRATVETILRERVAPVLVVKRRVRGGYRSVLVGTDFSEPSRAALQAASALFPQARLAVLHAYHAPGLAGIEQKDVTKFQNMMLGMFSMLRKLNTLSKKLPGKRFWRFNGGMHIVLTLVPPHRTYGPMTHGMVEPIYCGAWHPAANICTFCPGREYITLNFTMEDRHIANVDKIITLLDRVEAMDFAPRDKVIVEAEI